MERRAPLLALLAVLLVGWGLRLFRLGDATLWWDEGWSVWLARMSLAESAWQTARDVHPPLHGWLLSGWRALVGESEFALRASSALLGTLTLAALYDLGRLLFKARALPLVAALLLATSRFHVWWSQELRSYALGALLVTLSLALTVRLRWRPSRAVWVGYAVTTIAAYWTLYLLLLLPAIQGLYWLATLRDAPHRRRLVTRGLVALGGGLLGALPWLLFAVPVMRGGSAGGTEGSFLPFLQLFATLLTLGTSTAVERTLPLVLAVLLAVGLGWWQGRHAGRRHAALLLGGALVVPLVLVWLVTTAPRSVGYLPKPEARYLLPFAPAFALLLAWGVQGARRRARRAVALAGLLALSLWSLNGYFGERYRSDEYASLTQTLRAYAAPGDGVLLHSDAAWPVFDYHWRAAWHGTPHLQEADPSGVAYQLAPLWQAHEVLWVVVNPDGLRVDPARLYERWLADRAADVREWRFGQARLLRFARNAQPLALAPTFEPPAPARPLRGDGMTLLGWEQALTRLRAGEPLHVALTVERAGTGGIAHLALGDPPLAAAEVEIPPGEGRWRGVVSLQPPPDAPGGPLPVRLSLGGESATLGRVELLPLPAAPPALPTDPDTERAATFGDPVSVRLLGYDLEGSPQAGAPLELTLYWKAVQPLPLAYKVFVHLTDDAGEIVAQSDAEPQGGERPTTTWRRGDQIADRHVLALPERLPPGRYTLSIGLYDPTSGVRLAPVEDETGPSQAVDHLVVQPIDVEE